MDSIYKLVLLILVTFFLIFNARAEKPANDDVVSVENSFADTPHSSFVLSE